MSFISAGNTTTTTLLINGDTTGNLVFNTGGANTTALTITNTQAATFANNVTITGTTAHTGNASFSNVTTTGSIGVGTTSPNNYLQVTGAKTNTDAASTGQMVIQDTTAYNGSPIAGIQFSVKYTSSGTYAFGTAIQGIKDNSTDGNFGQSLRFVTQANGASPSEKMRLTSAGQFLIGTSSADGWLTNYPAATSVGYVQQKASSGGTDHQQFYTDGTLFAKMTLRGSWYNFDNVYGALSDASLKENIVDAAPKLDDLLKVQVRNYNFKTDPNKKQIGVIAQELEQVFPSIVEEDSEGLKAVKYSVLVPILIKAVQELNAKVEAQAAEIAALKAGA